MAFTDMQGRLLGKRLHRDFFLEQVDHGHGTEGCNYLLALDMEMDPIPGYEIASWERGYGDFELAPDLATLRRLPWLEATALVLCDVLWLDGSPVRPSPRQVLRAQLERARCARVRRDGRLGARVLLAARDVRGGASQGLSRPDAVGAVHPRLPHPRHDLRRAAAAPDPQRHAGRRHPRRDVEGRGVARPAGDQLPLRRRADDGGQPRRLQERREGDRASERMLDHVHGEAVARVDRLVVSHPFVACGATGRRRSRRTTCCSGGTSRVRSRARASSRCSSRRTINSYKRYAAGSWAPTTLAWGIDNRTCGFRIVGSGGARAGRVPDPGRRRESRTSRSRRRSRRGSTASRTSWSSRRRSRGTRTSRRCERFPSTLREAVAALEGGSVARGGARRRRRRPLLELRAHRAGAVRSRRHRLGAGEVVRAWLSAGR